VTSPGEIGPGELAEVGRALARRYGLSLASGLRDRLRAGLAAAAAARGEGAVALARRILGGEPEAVEALAEHAVVLETSFFRHPEQLAALEATAFRRAGPLSIWSAGCATGEEPYTVAIALLEAGRAGRGDRVLATDVSERALAVARSASYGSRALRRVPPGLAERWFSPAPARTVAPEARALVALERHNLVADPIPEGAFDVVLCRNVLIYFETAVAAAVLDRLAAALRPGGLLVVGPVELPLATALPLDPLEQGGATLLRRAP
jgi:chemotaxis protein methyltransferase CheR